MRCSKDGSAVSFTDISATRETMTNVDDRRRNGAIGRRAWVVSESIGAPQALLKCYGDLNRQIAWMYQKRYAAHRDAMRNERSTSACRLVPGKRQKPGCSIRRKDITMRTSSISRIATALAFSLSLSLAAAVFSAPASAGTVGVARSGVIAPLPLVEDVYYRRYYHRGYGYRPYYRHYYRHYYRPYYHPYYRHYRPYRYYYGY
jgi:hypothetical protein